MLDIFFSYVQSKALKRELRVYAVLTCTLFLVVVFLLVQNSQLNARLEVLENTFLSDYVDPNYPDTPVVSYTGYDDASVWAKLSSLEERINNLDARTTRFVVLPEGANDLGAAMEGTVQWQGLFAKVGNNEARIGEVSGQVAAVDWAINNLSARFPMDHSNLNTWDAFTLDLAELRAKVVVFESMQYIEANQAVVIDTLFYTPDQMTLPGAILHPTDQALLDSGENDVIERWLTPVRNGQINFIFNDVSFNLSANPGDEVSILESSSKVLLIQVYDPIYEEGISYWGDLDTGEIFEGQPPANAYED